MSYSRLFVRVPGTPYYYSHEADRIVLRSAGPDKAFGTEDDIVEAIKLKRSTEDVRDP